MAAPWTPIGIEPAPLQSGVVGVLYPLFKITSPPNTNSGGGSYSESFFFHNGTNPNLVFGLTIAEHPELDPGEIWFFGTPTIAGYGEFQVENSRVDNDGFPIQSLFHTFSLNILPAPRKKKKRKGVPIICCKPENFIDGKCKPFVQFQGYKYVRIGETDCYMLVKK